MFLELITPDRTIFSGEILLVQLPGHNGSFEILKNHAPIISSLVEGMVRIIDFESNEIKYLISGGIVECKKNKVFILTDKVN